MSRKYASVVVHLSGPVGTAERVRIERAIATQPGVGRAATSPTARRLMLVDYDPFTTTARHILETVRGRGVGAQLIGM
jgi:hypothetical protein